MDRRARGVLSGCAALLCCATALPALPSAAAAAPRRGDLIVADARAFGGGALLTVDPATGAESVLSSNAMPVNASSQLFDKPFTVSTNRAGEIFVANTANMGGSCAGGCGGVIKVNPETGAETVLSSNAMAVNASSQYFHELTGIAVEPDGKLLVTDWGGKLGLAQVIRVDPVSGKETLLSSNSMPVNASSELFAYPQGVIANGAGEIFVADPLAFGEHGGGIIAVNPVTGKESEVSTNAMPVNSASQYFHAPSQLAFNAAGNLLVADWCQWSATCGGIIEVNLQTGKQTELASNSLAVNATSEYFSEPVAIAVNEAGTVIETQEAGLGTGCEHGCGGLVSVDPATGKETELSANALPVNSESELYVEPFDVTVYGYTPSLTLGSHPGGPGSGSGSGPGAPGSSGPGGPSAGSPRRLAIGHIAQSRRHWRETGKHHTTTRKRGPRAGTSFSFTLSQPARVQFEFGRLGQGRLVHGACRVANRSNRRRRACTVSRVAGTLVLTGHAGRNTLAFSGGLSGKRLAPGSYVVSVRAAGGGEVVVARGALRFVIAG